ncbi:non-specific lipid transfer protein GPI-anchored 1-like [Tasmannia lanceolata]|uniref:non-specific lipid transfer protein GPI-anchored 1-like n=1 Tax=Tasmannia lanceolata TaxID=3420 RepID=UPI0040643575
MKKPQSLFISFLFLSSIFGLISCSNPIQDKCNNEFTKVYSCLDYGSAKTATPSESCCKSTKQIRDEEAVCLCYIIQQTYEGLPALKSLGLQVPRLLQLPTQCNLANTSSSYCPKLLNIAPSSPEYSIFMNSSAATSNSTRASSGTPTSGGSATPESSGCIHGPHFAGGIIPIIVAIFSSIVPIWA